MQFAKRKHFYMETHSHLDLLTTYTATRFDVTKTTEEQLIGLEIPFRTIIKSDHNQLSTKIIRG